jgi:hypothetical protein
MHTQLQTQTIETSTPRPDLDERLTEAQAQHEKLLEAATEAAALADAARITFEREPTAKHHTDAAIAGQKAINARADAEKFRGNTLEPLQRAKAAELEAVEREELRRALDWNRVQLELDAIETAIRGLADALDSRLPALGALLAERKEKSARAFSLGLTVAPATAGQLIDEMGTRLAAQYRDPTADAHQSLLRLVLGDNGSKVGTFRVELQRPAHIPGHVR